MEVGLCKGKKLYDKRADAAQRDAKRSIDRAMKSNGKYYWFFQTASWSGTFSKLSAHRKVCFIRGRKGFDGESEVWAAGSSGGTAL